MAVFINQPNALALMAQLEGDRWLQEQHRFPKSETGFFVWLAAFNWRLSKEGRDELASLGMEPHELSLQEVIGAGLVPVDSKTVQGVIYGAGGYDRFYVSNDGEIVFLASYAVDQGRIDLAKTLGFSVR